MNSNDPAGSAQDVPDVSIIIVNWNTRELLRRCLHSIRRETRSLAVQTIVVDNQSGDGSPDMVRQEFPEMELLPSGGNLGFGRANNLGIARARAPYVVFLNPDTEIRDQALNRMRDCLRQQPETGLIQCKLVGLDGKVQELGIQRFPSPWTEIIRFLLVFGSTQRRLSGLMPYHSPEKSGYVHKLFGACLMVRREILDTVGGFDERFFMYCEDVDLCQRILAAGWKLYYLSEVEIIHVGAGASTSAPSQFSVLMTCESFEKLMRKYYGLPGAVTYRVVTFAGSVYRIVILAMPWLVAALAKGRRRQRLAGAIRKHFVASQWALGLRTVTVAHGS